MKIKNIVFDLGGVIVDLDVERTYSAFRQFIDEGVFSFESGYLSHPVLKQYETGQICSDTFVAKIQELGTTEVSKEEVIAAWNAMLVEIPDSRVRLLEQLGQNYRLFALSNTNYIHEQKFERMANGYELFKQLFEEVYYSHKINCRKPDPEAFKVVINGSGLVPSETLFVDDLLSNIETARSLGFKTLHVTNGLDIIKWFEEYY